ncbi:FxsA family protein [Streptomyces sp. NBC_01476]|uniref:FxsA family membrane protein n=1 Tax=Streptomyces sp. NBC_01476 TaxID=2903881 RepID=UPI002E379B29|nr:FxsA family membrane protein [Streptomyces sp. NBC_01476]
MTTSSPPPVRPQPTERPQRRRSRARTVVPLVIAAWAVLEIWLLIVVAGATNGFVVFLCILAGFVLGAAAVKRAGRSAWRNLAATVQRQQRQAGGPGPAEGEEPLQPGGSRTGLHMLGGMLLIIPGFVSDAVGLVLLFPPTRKLTGAILDRVLARKLSAPATAADPGSLGDLLSQAREAEEQSRIHRPDGKVIPGEVVDRDKP